MDLILLAKIVKMEADIRTAQLELDAVGMMVANKRGTQIPNPLISVIDTLERRQLAGIHFTEPNGKRSAHDQRHRQSGKRGWSSLEGGWRGWAACPTITLI